MKIDPNNIVLLIQELEKQRCTINFAHVLNIKKELRG
jgi:hypothetical protein